MTDEATSDGGVKLGVLLWSQATDWPSFAAHAQRADELGYEHLWAWDHLYAIFGDPYQDIFEGWMTLAAWAGITRRARLGLLVGANTFRNPGLVAKLAVTLDHVSGGRAILGLGGAWQEIEHRAHGIEFGRSAGQRLDWLDQSAGIIRRVLDGETVSFESDKYRFEELRHHPLPLQGHLPIMIGGSGEKKTLRTIAKYADMWNGMGTVETMRHKVEVLHAHCEAVGRDPAQIVKTLGCKPIIRDTESAARRVWESQMEHNRTPMSDVAEDQTFWAGTPQQLAEKMVAYRDLGFGTFIAEMAAPFDDESLERWIGEVKPMVDAA